MEVVQIVVQVALLLGPEISRLYTLRHISGWKDMLWSLWQDPIGESQTSPSILNQSCSIYCREFYAFQKTISGMILGTGRGEEPDYEAPNDHVL